MKTRICLIITLFFSLITIAQADNVPKLRTVSQVDLNQYLGRWYEIAKFPNSFQKNCVNAMADYSLRDDGGIAVLNSCAKVSNGEIKTASGIAWVVDRTTNAKLKVTFLPQWIRWTGIGVGQYWVIDLGPNYEYSVVSEPSRKYLWILSRTSKMDPEVYKGILERLTLQHFDLSKLVPSRTEQISP